MGNTLREIIAEVYNILGEEDSSTIFDKNNTVIPKINGEILNVCRGQVRNFYTKSMMRSGLLGFLHKEDVYKIPTVKTLVAPAIAGDTILHLDDIIMPQSGTLFVFDMFVEYNIVGNEVVLSEELDRDIDELESVRFAIKKPMQSIQYKDIREYTTNNKLEFFDFQERPINKDIAYTVIPYQGNEYLVFSKYTGKVIVPYVDKPQPLEDLEDECVLPDNYGKDIIAGLVAGKLLLDDQQNVKGQNALLYAYDKLTEMYNFYSDPIKQRRKQVKVKPMNLYMY